MMGTVTMGNALPRVDSYSDQSHSLAGLAEDPLTSYSAQPTGRRNEGKDDDPPSRGSKNRGLDGMWCMGRGNGNEKFLKKRLHVEGAG